VSTLRSFLTIFAVLSFVVLGSVSAYAQGGARSSCDELFAEYASGKEFMNLTDFQQYWANSGHKEQNTMGNAPIGGADSAFLEANKSKNNQLSKSEFCAWLRHSPEAER